MGKDKYLNTVKVGEKGQIVIPKPVRDMFGILPGDTMILLADIEKGIAIVNFDEYKEFAEKIFSRNKRKGKDSNERN